ncbi:conjugative transfer system coupling protein TraD [Yersinia intermedia]|uniref:conjugative transfer system coupling protein TraD n=1 Tax=Yersinia intermedia TaxID=631 RepID=UPI00065CCBBF|nr:conjugative transfer system coupling protein TraD [Yersinia intermedia]CRY84106.1 TraG-family protein [Yersinia intermedia]
MGLPKRTDLHSQENLYRPVFEFRSAAVLFICAAFATAQNVYIDGMAITPVIFATSAMLVLLGMKRIHTAIPYFKAHWRVFYRVMLFISLEELRNINKSQYFADEKKYQILLKNASEKNKSLPVRRTYLCDGYEWGAEHSERAHQIHNLSSDYREIKLPSVLKPISRHFNKLARTMGGNNSIFGVDRRDANFVTEENWFGHTLITGNVGTGKTVLLRLLSSSMLHLGHVVVIVDPKNDPDWQKSMRDECKSLGKPFYHFHPAQPSTSVSIDVCHNIVKDSDLTNRLISLISSVDDNDGFIRFGESLITTIIGGTKLAGDKPTIKGIYQNMRDQFAILNITIRAFEKFYANVFGADLWAKTVNVDNNLPQAEKYKQYAAFFQINFTNYDGINPPAGIDTLFELIKYVQWDPAHMSKMTASLNPLFTLLSESPMDDLLSPTNTMRTNRVVVNSEGMFNSGGVLYISLDGLSNPKTARAVAQLITADLAACAGKRYNATDGSMETNSRISFFIDEAHSAINTSMLNLLAQGRAAKIALFVCTQTIADVVAASDEATASRITGLCNNFISLRVNDLATQTLVVDNFGKSSINTNQVTYTTGTGTQQSHTDFSGSISERKSTSLEDSIPKELLGQVPNLHIIARLQDGRKLVGQIPISVPAPAMRPATTVIEMLIRPTNKVTLRKNLDANKVLQHLKRAA